jgi:hypothetical protein
MSPALRKEMVNTETSELDCMMVVAITPNDRLFQVASVVRCRKFASKPPLNDLNPFSRDSMPRRNIATPAAMVLKSGLIQKP